MQMRPRACPLLRHRKSDAAAGIVMAYAKFCPQCSAPLVRQPLKGVDRRLCKSCDFVHWDNPVPVVAGLVELAGDVVLARNAAWPPGVFSLISGFLEKGETPEQAVAREIREELGLESETIEHIGNYSLFAQNQLIIAFRVRARGQVQLGDELAEVRLTPQKNVEAKNFKNLPITAAVIRDWRVLNARRSGTAMSKADLED